MFNVRTTYLLGVCIVLINNNYYSGYQCVSQRTTLYWRQRQPILRYCISFHHFNVLVENFTSYVTLYLYLCLCRGLRLSDLNKETTYLLTYLWRFLWPGGSTFKLFNAPPTFTQIGKPCNLYVINKLCT